MLVTRTRTVTWSCMFLLCMIWLLVHCFCLVGLIAFSYSQLCLFPWNYSERGISKGSVDELRDAIMESLGSPEDKGTLSPADPQYPVDTDPTDGAESSVCVDYEEVASLSLNERVALWLVADVFLLTSIRFSVTLFLSCWFSSFLVIFRRPSLHRVLTIFLVIANIYQWSIVLTCLF